MADDLGANPPNKVTTEQILGELMREIREGRDVIAEKVNHKLRVENPPAPQGASKFQVATIIVAILSPLFTAGLMTSYWRGQDATTARFEKIEKEQATSKEERAKIANEAEALKKEDESLWKNRDVLKAARDEQIKSINDRLKEMQDFGIRIGNVEGSYRELRKLYEDGRGERLSVQDKVNDRIGGVDTRLQIMEDRMRNGGREPFPFDRNQTWRGLPLRPPPSILRVTLSLLDGEAIRRGSKGSR